MQNYQNDDREFLHSIENHTLPKEHFNHESHLRLACLYYWQMGFDSGLSKLAHTIRSYAESVGATEKYHATVTYAYFRAVVEVLLKKPSLNNWLDVKSIIQDKNKSFSLERVSYHYSEFLLSTPEAKKSFLLPDINVFNSDKELNQPPYEWVEGQVPVLISMPHNGTCVPQNIQQIMTDEARQLKDTDWFLRLLYSFAIKKGCYLINPLYSRYVIDLNRSSTGEELYPGANNTELCPTTTFNLEPIYQSGHSPNKQEIERRINNYWLPYHSRLQQEIDSIRSKFGRVLLFEAHSIASVVPRFFEGQLPDFNFGTNNGVSCNQSIAKLVTSFDTQQYSKVVNGRFKGGYITRQYAKPESGVSSLQLELSQATYMDEKQLEYSPERAEQVKVVLADLIDNLIREII
ncbi:N-formylglutamate deformylase [Pleionea sediminis]|uniref:N-formylglutamate deformylase n=1 Tax=Pleionea sediminis TaxID=2569479 RepID=UPI001FEBA5B4|nr:N-formylglutamate deformylase [Pleionea sediminis]